MERRLTQEEAAEKERRQKSRWNIYNLIPSREEGYEEHEEAEYQYKMLCYQAAGGVISEYSRLFNECSLVEVYEIIMLKKAYDW